MDLRAAMEIVVDEKYSYSLGRNWTLAAVLFTDCVVVIIVFVVVVVVINISLSSQ
jgi:hypothetical protein